MNSHFFETMSKRRKGYPSETQVKRGVRIIHGDKMLEEKNIELPIQMDVFENA